MSELIAEQVTTVTMLSKPGVTADAVLDETKERYGDFRLVSIEPWGYDSLKIVVIVTETNQ